MQQSEQPHARNAPYIDAQCIEVNTGFSGRLIVNSDKIDASLYRFNSQGEFIWKFEKIELILEHGQHASALNCVSRNSSKTGYGNHIDHHKIKANYLFLGSRHFKDDEIIYIHEFCLPEAHWSLSYNEHRNSELDFDGNGSTETIKYFDHKMDIIHLDMGEYEVTISKQSRINISRRENIGDDPTFINIIYKNGVNFFDALQLPYQIVQFSNYRKEIPFMSQERRFARQKMQIH